MAGPGATQSAGQAEQAKSEQQQSSPKYADRKTGGALVCRQSGAGQQNSYQCSPARNRSAVERAWRWTFRLARDPIAVLTLALFVIGGVQVEISRRTAKRQLRAYIFADSVNLFDGATLNPPQPQYENHPSVTVTVKNTGETPASQLYHAVRLEVRPRHEEGLLSQPQNPPVSASYVPRGATVTKTAILGRQLAPQEIAGLNATTHAIYVIGRVDYVDAFKRKRFANYRLYYTGTYPNAGAQFYFCDQGNEAN